MKIGVTGTRDGLSPDQRRILDALVSRSASAAKGSYEEITEVHFGDCIGVDQQVAEAFIEAGLGGILHAHPATKSPEWDAKYRAHVAKAHPGAGIVVHPAKDPLERNVDIVEACDVLWAFPKDMSNKGGTWYTINKALDAGTFVRIIAPTVDNPKDPI